MHFALQTLPTVPSSIYSALGAFLLNVEVKHFYITSVETFRYVSSTDILLRSWWLLSP